MWRDIKIFFRKGDTLTRLIIVNGAVFIGIQLVWLFAGLMNSNAEKSIGSDLFLAASSSITVLASRPWSIVTHLFTHVGFAHFFFNMIMLYAAGRMFQFFIGANRLLVVYLLGGWCGFFLYFLFYNIFPALDTNSMILGASASVMAVFIAVAVVEPEREVKFFGILDIKLKWLAVLFVLLDLLSLRKGDNMGGHIGHFGGAVFGYLYGKKLLQGKPIGDSWANTFANWARWLNRKPKMKVTQKNPRMKSDEEFNEEKKRRQKRVDEILDKISRSGYEHLTKEEKDFLFQNSQK
jgi:membrane associated rhomboid family serine protease